MRANPCLDRRPHLQNERCHHVRFQGFKELADVYILGLLRSGKPAGKSQCGFYHGLHFFNGGHKTVAGFIVINHFGSHTHGRKWGSKIMPQGGQKSGSICHEPGQAVLHAVESRGQVTHFGRSNHRQVRNVFAPSQSVCRPNQSPQWASQPGHQEPEDHDQDHCRRQRKS